MKKKYEYRIALFEDGKVKRVIQRGRNYKNIKKKYNDLIKKSKKVIFPQNYTSKQYKNKKIEHQLCLITNDPKKNEYLGFNNQRIPLNEENFKVVFLEDYHVEEKFYTYPEQKQKDFFEICKDLKKINGIISSYQINNKIIFETILDIQYMVVCKDETDANMLYSIFRGHKNSPYIYIGKMSQNTMKIRAEKIRKRFGISYKRFHNTRTKA